MEDLQNELISFTVITIVILLLAYYEFKLTKR